MKGWSDLQRSKWVEYRTVSNYYLASNALKKWAFNSTKKAIDFLNKNGFLDVHLAEFVRETIDTNDKDQAMMLIERFNLDLVK